MLSKSKNKNLLILIFLFLVCLFYLLKFDWQQNHKNFSITMFDVGQGDAILIESNTGKKMLVDAGPPGNLTKQLSKRISIFDKKIDAVLITNPDQDHIGDLSSLLDTYQVDAIFEPGTTSDSNTYKNLLGKIKKYKIRHFILRKGAQIIFDDKLSYKILFPDRDVYDWKTNDGSMVGKLSYDNFSMMFMGDATSKTEEIILKENKKNDLRSTILKVGHHGSRSSTGSEFLKAVSPFCALISVGENNKYGHPHKEVLDSLVRLSIKIFRTDLSGNIIVYPNDSNCILDTEK